MGECSNKDIAGTQAITDADIESTQAITKGHMHVQIVAVGSRLFCKIASCHCVVAQLCCTIACDVVCLYVVVIVRSVMHDCGVMF